MSTNPKGKYCVKSNWVAPRTLLKELVGATLLLADVIATIYDLDKMEVLQEAFKDMSKVVQNGNM